MGRTGRQLGIVITALVASVGVMVVSAPAADAKTVAVDQWAKAFCNAVKGWQSSVTKAHSLVDGVVKNGVTGSSQAKATQKNIVSVLAATSKASSDAAKAVKTLGTPNLKNGAKISSTLSAAIGNTAKVFSDAEAAVAKAPTDPKKFQSKMKSISDQVDRDYSAAGKDIAGIDALDAGGRLEAAFNAEPACSFATGA